MFASATISDFLTNFVSFGYGKIVGDAAGSGIGQVTLGMLSGDVGSALTGGNFWDGVQIGGIVAIFNHYAHKIDNPMESSIEEEKPKEDSSIMRIIKENSPLNVESEQGSSSSSFVFKRLKSTNWQVANVSTIRYTSVISLYPNLDVFFILVTRGYYQLPIKYSNGYVMPSNKAANIAAIATDYGLKETRNYYIIRQGNAMQAEMMNFLRLPLIFIWHHGEEDSHCHLH